MSAPAPAATATLSELFNIIQHATLPLPAIEVSMLLAILTACLLFRFTKMGLVAAYLFTYRWGWLILTEQPDADYLVYYLVFGVAAGILTVIGMLNNQS
jgi:hypothetical protein